MAAQLIQGLASSLMKAAMELDDDDDAFDVGQTNIVVEIVGVGARECIEWAAMKVAALVERTLTFEVAAEVVTWASESKTMIVVAVVEVMRVALVAAVYRLMRVEEVVVVAFENDDYRMLVVAAVAVAEVAGVDDADEILAVVA